MSHVDTEYMRIVNDILRDGRVQHNRTGIDTIGIFGGQARFNLEDGFPLLTTKKVFFKGIAHELLWFLSGSTNIKYLIDNDVHIWDEWAYKRYVQKHGDVPGDAIQPRNATPLTLDEYRMRMREDEQFARQWGELGEGTYGGMWRSFPYIDPHKMKHGFHITHGKNPAFPQEIGWMHIDDLGFVDQIRKVLNKLKSNPDDRRMIVSAWHPYWVDNCALPPCHCLFQFHTAELTEDERIKALFEKENDLVFDFHHKKPTMEDLDRLGVPKRRLSCQLYQRSCDMFLGVPFNIASYALLLKMVAQVSNMVAGDFIWTGGDIHLYTNSLDAIKEQSQRKPFKMPQVTLNPDVSDLFKFKYEDIKLEDYVSHPPIKVAVAV